MEKTNANDFRSNLKEWMEAARKEPVKITRKTGEAFVLLNAEDFEKIQIELATLRGISRGLNDALNGNIQRTSKKSIRDTINRAKEKVKKRKKAVS